tara:strand:- start:13657 stop:14505 length:849 start_codon:yes stop_codon:yes gene_type:complete
VAGLKLKFKENQLSSVEKPEESVGQVPEAKVGLPKPELLIAVQVGQPGPSPETTSKDKKRSNKYFYKVSNHHELFKIGSSFYEDYKCGVKSFAVSSTGYQTSQQTSILGLASFFDHKDDLKIAIVSDNLNEGAFKDIVSISKKAKLEIGEGEEPCDYFQFYGHFDFFDLDNLLEISNDESSASYDEVFDNLVDNYDLIFWDVPELHKIKKDSEKYFPVIMKFESLSIIVAQSLSNSKDVKEVQNFFMGYGINLKGLLFDTKQKLKEEEAEEKLKKPWWRIFG